MEKFIYLLLGWAVLSIASCKSNPEGPTETTFKTKIGIINIDGANLRYLTDGTRIIRFANYLPNGEKIVYVGENPDGKQAIYTMNPDGSENTPILMQNIFLSSGTPVFQEITQRMQFTTDSKKILFSPPSDEEYSINIYCVNTDGSKLLNLTNNTLNTISFSSFSVSNDDKMIVYIEHHYDGTMADYLCIRNIDGSNLRIIKKAALSTTILQYPQFLPTDNDNIVYFEGQKLKSPLTLKMISVSDTSKSTTIGLISILTQYPFILSTNKMIIKKINSSDDGVTTIDLLTGYIQSPNIAPLSIDVTVSHDETMFAWSNLSDKFGIIHSDGTGFKTLSGTVSEMYKLHPYISPNNQQILFLSSYYITGAK